MGRPTNEEKAAKEAEAKAVKEQEAADAKAAEERAQADAEAKAVMAESQGVAAQTNGNKPVYINTVGTRVDCNGRPVN